MHRSISDRLNYPTLELQVNERVWPMYVCIMERRVVYAHCQNDINSRGVRIRLYSRQFQKSMHTRNFTIQRFSFAWIDVDDDDIDLGKLLPMNISSGEIVARAHLLKAISL